jgi:small neutral amino acid transporter SnatA (MarC family)
LLRVKKLRIRLASIAVLAAAMLVTIAAPAGAATTVLADSKYQWFYWIGPILAVSFLGWLIMMAAGYYVRVLRPKWRGQKQS